MSRTLNNEVSIINIANQDNDIKDQFTRWLIADEEELIVASRDYDVNEFFIGNDRYLYKTLTAITAGTAFNIGTNVKRGTTVADELYTLYSQSPESLQAVMSNVEEGNNASKSYNAGQYIIWKDGFLYKLKTNVTLGTAWTVGTNIELKNNITDEITALNTALTTYEKTCNNHNIPRLVPKDISSYISDGTFYKRLNGTDGYTLFEDIYVGDYIQMSRAITAPNQDSQYAVTGSQYVTIIGLDTLMKNNGVSYHHAVMTAGQGFGGTQHFGRKRMYASASFTLGYVGSEMNTDTLGSVASSGSTASGATINQQLYAEFGSHLKTTSELLSTANNSTGVGRFGTASGCATNWAWTSVQAVLMSEIEVYGSVVWGASGYDIGTAKEQFPLFAFSKEAMNNGSAYYWLKDIASGSYFCLCGGSGDAYYNSATGASIYVRPRFVIGA